MVYNAVIIGCGRMGCLFEDDPKTAKPCTHAGAYSAVPEIKLVAGCDIVREKVDYFCRKWNVPGKYLDYKELLAKEKFDVLSICTHDHYKICIDAANSAKKTGLKLIFCEKPIAFSLKQADEMVKVCRKNNVALVVDHTRRWDSYFNHVCELLKKNEIGKIGLIQSYCTVGILNGGTHLFDMLRSYVGDAAAVSGFLRKDSNPDCGGYGVIYFKNDIVCFFDSSFRNYVLFGAEIFGENGIIKTGGMIRSGREFVLKTPKDSEKESKIKELVAEKLNMPEWEPPMLVAVKEIVAYLKSSRKTKLRCAGEDGRAALEIAMAVHESDKLGGAKVNLPLKNRVRYIVQRETSFSRSGYLTDVK